MAGAMVNVSAYALVMQFSVNIPQDMGLQEVRGMMSRGEPVSVTDDAVAVLRCRWSRGRGS
jgi:hypothetical protein